MLILVVIWGVNFPIIKSAFSNLIPVVALISSWALLGEPLGVVQIAAGAVVLLGVWLARKDEPAHDNP